MQRLVAWLDRNPLALQYTALAFAVGSVVVNARVRISILEQEQRLLRREIDRRVTTQTPSSSDERHEL